jgi:hypothetical protein
MRVTARSLAQGKTVASSFRPGPPERAAG